MKTGIIAQINTFNSDEYIGYVLKSCYDYVDKIVIIDGAFNSRMPDKVSTDKTHKIIEMFDDPAKKIKLEIGAGKTQEKQRQKIFKHIENYKWLFLIDDDEIYRPQDFINIKKYIEETNLDAYKTATMNFVNSFKWFYKTYNMRIWHIKQGMFYFGPNSIKHKIYPDMYDKEKAPIIPDAVRFHYSYVRDIGRLNIKKNQVKNLPWEKDGKFVKREIKLFRYDGKHPETMNSHPYKDIEWSPI